MDCVKHNMFYYGMTDDLYQKREVWKKDRNIEMLSNPNNKAGNRERHGTKYLRTHKMPFATWLHSATVYAEISMSYKAGFT